MQSPAAYHVDISAGACDRSRVLGLVFATKQEYTFCLKEITDGTAATICNQNGEQLRHSSRAVLSTKEQLVHLADVGDFNLSPTLQRSEDGGGREQLEAVPVFRKHACSQPYNYDTFAAEKEGKGTGETHLKLLFAPSALK